MQTPLVHDGRLYTCTDSGIISCFEAATGKQLYRERLGSGRAGATASIILADGKIYATIEDGRVIVLREGPTFKKLATSRLGEACLATPAVAEGVIFFRTRSRLVAVER